VVIYDNLYDDHPRLARTLRNGGDLARDGGEKATSYQASAEMYARLEGETGPTAVEVKLIWARSLLRSGRPGEALPRFRALREAVTEAYGEDHPALPAPFLGEAEALAALGRPDEARVALDSAQARMTGEADNPRNQEWLASVDAALGSGSP